MIFYFVVAAALVLAVVWLQVQHVTLSDRCSDLDSECHRLRREYNDLSSQCIRARNERDSLTRQHETLLRVAKELVRQEMSSPEVRGLLHESDLDATDKVTLLQALAEADGDLKPKTAGKGKKS